MASGTYSEDYVVIHGPLEKAQDDYPGTPVGFGNTSHDGDPAICMRLEVTDFKRTANNKLKCTIKEAYLRMLRPTTLGIGFGYPFKISACFVVAKPEKDQKKIQKLYNDSDHHGTTTLFKKYVYYCHSGPDSSTLFGWYDKGANTEVTVLEESTSFTVGPWEAQLKKSKTVTMPAPGADEAVYLFITNLSDCPCEQGGDDVVVFYKELTSYFPKDPDPYIWRLQQGKDPNHPDSGAAPAWHLVRPFYIYLEDKYGKGWRSCEDITKIV